MKSFYCSFIAIVRIALKAK